jgi:hypothetical protein
MIMNKAEREKKSELKSYVFDCFELSISKNTQIKHIYLTELKIGFYF